MTPHRGPLRQSHFVPPIPYLVALDLGLLDEGDVVATRTTGSPEQLAGLLAGELDVVITAIDNLFAWSEAGVDLRLVAQVEPTTPLGVYGRPGVSSLGELDGGRFGVDAVSNGFALVARHLIAQADIDVDYVEIGGVKERWDALGNDEIDATLLGPPFDVVAQAAGAPLITSVSTALPRLPGQGLVVRAELIGSAPLARYLTALQRAVRHAAEMDDHTGEALLTRAGFGGAAQRAWAGRPLSLHVDAAGLDLLTEIRVGLGLMPAGIHLHDLHDAAPLRQAAI
jgi:ABC-type nitrate/sulfonate/bicarbonate transport system substrate-binding protein